MEIGPATQSIEVKAGTSLLETASGSVNYHVESEEVEKLPLDGRNFIPLVALSPGVALPGSGSLLPRINSSRPRTNEYLYDGISVLQPEPGQVTFYPLIDAIEEFRLNIDAYSPECGRSNGGTVMAIGKSGTNQLHGTVFEFIRNEDFNARNYFAQPGAKPEFRRNQYGFAAGGPIRRNKTFFFGAAADGHHAAKRGSGFSAARGGVHEHDLRSRHIATHAISEQYGSGQPLRPDRPADPDALSGAEPERSQQLHADGGRAGQPGSVRRPTGSGVQPEAPRVRTLFVSARRR
jgi:hypothetical protein